MITPEQLEHFNTGFELSDAFGKARLKNLIFEMREQLLFDRSEVEKWRIIAEKQAEVISDLYFKLEHPDYEQALRDDNKILYEKLQRSLEVQSSLQEYASDLEHKLNQNGAQITRPKSWWPEVS